MPSLRHKRGTRAQIDAAATASLLKPGEVYLVSDEARLTVATATNAHQGAAKQGEGGGGADPWTWAALAADVANSTVTPAAVTGLSFTAAANSRYLVRVFGAFQSAATTTGIAMALDILSGTIIGQVQANITGTTLGGTEQIANAATTGATTGVRAINTNIPLTGWFVVSTGATGGLVQALFRSEVAASAVTLKAGLTVMGWRAV